MKDDLNRLARSLAKVIAFIDKHDLINNFNAKRFKTLKDTYIDLTKNGVDGMKYNFRAIKRDVNGIIHPDRIPANINKEAMALIAEFNGIIDDVQRRQKSPEMEPVTEKKEEAVDPFENFNTYGGFTETIKDAWYFVMDRINKVPRNEDDYFRIKNGFESIIEKLSKKISDKEKALAKLNNEIAALRKEWGEKLTPRAVEKAYKAKLDKLLKEYDKIALERASAMQAYYRKQSDLSFAARVDIQNRVQVIEAELKGAKAQYDSICAAGSGYDKKRYGDTKYTYAQMKKALKEKLEKFPNHMAVVRYVTEEILSNDREYRVLQRKAGIANDKFMAAKEEYENCLNNGNQAREEIISETNKKHTAKIDSLMRKRYLISSKHQKLQTRFAKTIEKRDEFLEKYQYQYEEVETHQRRAG